MRQPVQQLIECSTRPASMRRHLTPARTRWTRRMWFRKRSFSITSAEKNLKMSSTSGHGSFGWLLIKLKNINRTFWKKNRCSLVDYMETLTFPDSQSRDLFEKVMKLPDKFRIVIHLFYYEDYSVREIADILKLSESNVKVRLSRGRALLKEFFEGGVGK